MIQTAPEIVTDRLRLRAHHRGDAETLIPMWQDEAVVRYLGGQAMLPEDAWNRLLRYVGHWALNGFGLWAVEERAGGCFLGEVGLFEGRRGLSERFDSAPEAGWVFRSEAHGKGYAREAMAAALRWGESEYCWSRTVCMINPENEPSLRTAAHLRYRPFGTTTYKDKSLILLERIRT